MPSQPLGTILNRQQWQGITAITIADMDELYRGPREYGGWWRKISYRSSLQMVSLSERSWFFQQNLAPIRVNPTNNDGLLILAGWSVITLFQYENVLSYRKCWCFKYEIWIQLTGSCHFIDSDDSLTRLPSHLAVPLNVIYYPLHHQKTVLTDIPLYSGKQNSGQQKKPWRNHWWLLNVIFPVKTA